MQYVWFLWSAVILIAWLAVYVLLRSKESRREMFIVSLWTSLLGFLEPLFVPEYWSPPSLFDLAMRTGFDIESFMFAFGVGGIASVIYEAIFTTRHEYAGHENGDEKWHRYHFVSLLIAPVVFITLLMFTSLNPIYTAIIAMITGGFLTLYCRPDLTRKMVVSAFIFLVFYFLYFLTLIAMYPDYVEGVWNISAISGILIFGVPLEELLFAASVGFLWSSLYEHVMRRRVIVK